MFPVSNHKRKLLAVAALAAVLTSGGCARTSPAPAADTLRSGTGIASETTDGPVKSGVLTLPSSGTNLSSAVAQSPPVPSISTDPKALVDDVLSRLDTSVFLSAKIGISPGGGEPEGDWFYATMLAKDNTPESSKYAIWQAYTAQGALSVLLANSGHRFVGSTFKLQLPDGSVLPDGGGGVGGSYGHQDKESDPEIQERITTTLQKYGLDASAVRIFRPLPPEAAVAVTILVPDPKLLAGKVATITADLQNPEKVTFESIFFRFESTSGETLSILFGDRLVGVGSQWIEPGHNEYGTAHGGGGSSTTTSTTSPSR